MNDMSLELALALFFNLPTSSILLHLFNLLPFTVTVTIPFPIPFPLPSPLRRPAVAFALICHLITHDPSSSTSLTFIHRFRQCDGTA
jgi:hypothetical protein